MRAWPTREPAAGARRPAVFLDRDGVLVHNRAGYYLTDPGKMRIYPFAARALRLLSAAGFRLLVVTNQSAVARGYMTLRAAIRINVELARALRKQGAYLDGIYLCPHGPDGGCSCRKPAAGLLKEAFGDFPTVKGRSWMIGDKFSDVAMAERGGLRPVLVLTGQGRGQLRGKGASRRGTAVARDLLAAARVIAAGAGKK
ncbi:MAG TPA: HAD family hydrolase [Elusimicrobiales bacterium]|nr:HAD family hydrolase [Elusimicrobiales bacterium]